MRSRVVKPRPTLLASVTTALTLVLLATGTTGLADDGPREVEASRGRVLILRQAILAADRIGIVSKDLPREGDRVKAGTKVVQLWDELHAAGMKVARAKADNDAPIAAARREYDVSVAELAAAEQANAQVPNAIPGIEVERLRLARDRNELRIEQAESNQQLDELEHGRLEVELDTYRVLAPFDGIVTKVHRSRGEAVRQGDPIVEVVDARTMKVEAFVTVADAFRVRRGDEVTVEPVVPGVDLPSDRRTTKGRLVFVDLKVQPVTGLVRVWAEVENPYGYLLDGLDARMTITAGSGAADEKPAKPDA